MNKVVDNRKPKTQRVLFRDLPNGAFFYWDIPGGDVNSLRLKVAHDTLVRINYGTLSVSDAYSTEPVVPVEVELHVID